MELIKIPKTDFYGLSLENRRPSIQEVFSGQKYRYVVMATEWMADGNGDIGTTLSSQPNEAAGRRAFARWNKRQPDAALSLERVSMDFEEWFELLASNKTYDRKSAEGAAWAPVACRCATSGN